MQPSLQSSWRIRRGALGLALVLLGGVWLVQYLRTRPHVFHDTHQVLAVAFSPDGKTLATGHQLTVEDRRMGWAYGAGDIQLRDVTTGRVTRTISFLYPSSRREDDDKSVPVTWLSFSPGGGFLMASNMGMGGGDTVGILNISTGKWTATLRRSGTYPYDRLYRPLGFSPDSRRAYFLVLDRGASSPSMDHFDEDLHRAQHEATLIACDPPTGRVLSRMPHLLKRGEWPVQEALLADGSAVALAVGYATDSSYASGGDSIALISTADGARLRTLPVRGDMQPSLVSAPGINRLAYSSQRDTVTLWNSGPNRGSTLSAPDISTGLALSPDGSKLAFSTHTGSIGLVDLAKRSVTRSLGGGTRWTRSLTFSPDGHTLAATDGDKTILMWRI